MRKLSFSAVAICLITSAAQATTVDTSLTVDNSFSYYISTNDAVEGTLIGTGTAWTSTYSFSQFISPGVTNYLHVKGTDVGAISAFIGQFSLSDSAATFANGTQALVTNTTDWGVNLTGFGNAYSTPITWGANGQSPWGTRPQIAANAQFIWDPSKCTYCTAYFSTQISAVPEPASLAMMALGFGLVGFASRRKLSLRNTSRV